jgi:hypothetical protein
MTSPFQFKYPFPPQAQPSTPTPSTPLSARQFILPRRLSATPQSSLSAASQRITEDIDDDEEQQTPRKRTRYPSIHDSSSEDEEIDFDSNLRTSTSHADETLLPKRPPVIVPQQTPDSDAIDTSPSRRKMFQPHGLAAFASKIIHEYTAQSSVAVPGLDEEDTVVLMEIKVIDGGMGYMCQADSPQGKIIVFLLVNNGLPIPRKVRKGDVISISNAVRLDTTWICTSWRHKNQ